MRNPATTARLIAVLALCGLTSCASAHRVAAGASAERSVSTTTTGRSPAVISTVPTTAFHPKTGAVPTGGDPEDALLDAVDHGLPPVLRGQAEGHEWSVFVYQVRQGQDLFECHYLLLGTVAVPGQTGSGTGGGVSCGPVSPPTTPTTSPSLPRYSDTVGAAGLQEVLAVGVSQDDPGTEVLADADDAPSEEIVHVAIEPVRVSTPYGPRYVYVQTVDPSGPPA